MNEARIKIEIVNFVDESNPGWVTCRLIDANGVEHWFREKAPVVTAGEIWADSDFPLEGEIACVILSAGPESVVVDTQLPWGVESTTGQTQFEINRAQLVADS
jgi:hypothetical protein